MKTPMGKEDVVSGDQVIPSGRFVVAEYTTDMGPMTNDYFLCLAFENGETIERVPGDSHRNERLFRELEARCGRKLNFGQLVNSTDYATVILHPLELCDFPYFEFLDRLATKDEVGLWGQILRQRMVDVSFSPQVVDYLGWTEEE